MSSKRISLLPLINDENSERSRNDSSPPRNGKTFILAFGAGLLLSLLMNALIIRIELFYLKSKSKEQKITMIMNTKNFILWLLIVGTSLLGVFKCWMKAWSSSSSTATFKNHSSHPSTETSREENAIANLCFGWMWGNSLLYACTRIYVDMKTSSNIGHLNSIIFDIFTITCLTVISYYAPCLHDNNSNDDDETKDKIVDDENIERNEKDLSRPLLSA